MFFADWLLTVIASELGLKLISDELDTNSTHTQIRASHKSYTCVYSPVVSRGARIRYIRHAYVKKENDVTMS